MKKLTLIIVVLLITGLSVSYGQANDVKTKTGKKDQSELYNNFYFSYGLGSVFYFIDHYGDNANNTTGTILLGYSRSFNKVIAVGFQVSYTQISRTQTIYHSTGSTYNKWDDVYWQGLASIRFQYVNRPSFCMYSGIGMGVAMDNNNKIGENTTQQLFPGGQLTLLGFRVGRTVSFFGEFGVGTNSIINAGMSFKFGDDN